MVNRLCPGLLLVLLSIVLSVQTTYSQNEKGSILGIVLTSDSTPAAGVNIRLENPQTATKTDADGSFRFKGLTGGSYRVIASMGRDTVSGDVVVLGSSPAKIRFRLGLSSEQLQEVIVTTDQQVQQKGNRQRGQTAA